VGIFDFAKKDLSVCRCIIPNIFGYIIIDPSAPQPAKKMYTLKNIFPTATLYFIGQNTDTSTGDEENVSQK
jgi:hypothetical protein